MTTHKESPTALNRAVRLQYSVNHSVMTPGTNGHVVFCQQSAANRNVNVSVVHISSCPTCVSIQTTCFWHWITELNAAALRTWSIYGCWEMVSDLSCGKCPPSPHLHHPPLWWLPAHLNTPSVYSACNRELQIQREHTERWGQPKNNQRKWKQI